MSLIFSSEAKLADRNPLSIFPCRNLTNCLRIIRDQFYLHFILASQFLFQDGRNSAGGLYCDITHFLTYLDRCGRDNSFVNKAFRQIRLFLTVNPKFIKSNNNAKSHFFDLSSRPIILRRLSWISSIALL